MRVKDLVIVIGYIFLTYLVFNFWTGERSSESIFIFLGIGSTSCWFLATIIYGLRVVDNFTKFINTKIWYHEIKELISDFFNKKIW